MLDIHTRRVLLTVSLPTLCLVLAYAFNQEVYQFVLPIYSSLPYVPFLLLVAGLVLAWGYHNGRELHLLLCIAVIYWAVRYFIWNPNLPVSQQSLLFASLCIGLPLAFLLHAVLPERGVWRWHMLRRLGLTLLPLGAITLLVYRSNPALSSLLFSELWTNPWPGTLSLPQPGLLAFGVVILVLGIQLVLHPGVLRAGVLMSLITLAIALNSIAQPSMMMVYISIAAAAILLGMLLNSYNLAYLDELTNLPSRRALKQHMMGLHKRYSIAMLDLDFFKKLNDRYGHDVGDQALRMVATQLARVGGGGKAYRYGGEEFTIVFNNKDAREALIHVDALRERIAKNPFIIRSRKRPRSKPEIPQRSGKLQKVSVTISAGIAEHTEQHESVNDVFKSADKALYTAKRAGRNRVHAI